MFSLSPDSQSLGRSVASLLQREGFGTVGTDIFLDELPADPGNAIMLTSTAGLLPNLYLDTQYATIDVWSRDSNSLAGWQKLNGVYTLLHRSYALSLDNYHVWFVHALGEIEPLDRDTEGRSLKRLSMRFIYRRLDNIS